MNELAILGIFLVLYVLARRVEKLEDRFRRLDADNSARRTAIALPTCDTDTVWRSGDVFRYPPDDPKAKR